MASYDVFVNRLNALTGLNKDVLNAWAAAENGKNNNILGVTSGGSLVTYPNQSVAADATAAFLNNNGYSGILATRGKSSQVQALAIAKSKWRLGQTGLSAVGGTDPYYLNVFIGHGILPSSLTPSTNTPPSTTNSGPPLGLGLPFGLGQPSAITGKTPSVPNIDIPGALMFIAVIFVGITFILVGGIIVLRKK